MPRSDSWIEALPGRVVRTTRPWLTILSSGTPTRKTPRSGSPIRQSAADWSAPRLGKRVALFEVRETRTQYPLRCFMRVNALILACNTLRWIGQNGTGSARTLRRVTALGAGISEP